MCKVMLDNMRERANISGGVHWLPIVTSRSADISPCSWDLTFEETCYIPHTTFPPTGHTAQCILNNAHYILHTAHCTLHMAHYTLHTANWTLRTRQCTLHITTDCTLKFSTFIASSSSKQTYVASAPSIQHNVLTNVLQEALNCYKIHRSLCNAI